MPKRSSKRSSKRSTKRLRNVATMKLIPLPPRGSASAIIANITQNVSLVTSGAGVASFNVTTLSATSSTDWSSFAGLFWQFRVRRMRVRYIPYTIANNANGYGAGALATYNEDTTPGLPASIAAVMYREDSRPIYIGKPLTALWFPVSPDDYLFQPVAGTTIRGGVLAYMNGGPFSTTIGMLFIDMDVEFTRS
jgi:hypothetical protein